jgi:acetyl esterase/lipase
MSFRSHAKPGPTCAYDSQTWNATGGKLVSMQLSPLARTRVLLGRPVVRALLGSRAVGVIDRLAPRAAGLDPVLGAILTLDELVKEGKVWRHEPRLARVKMAESVGLVEDDPPGGVRSRPCELRGPAGALAARFYEPEGLAPGSPGLLYIHGGGWVCCDLDTHDVFCRRLAKTGRLRVVSVAYRLAPEAPFPAAVEDVLAAWESLCGKAVSLGIDRTRLGAAGDSAGGNLSAVLGLRTRRAATRPALVALIYPSVDATCSFPSHTEFGEGYFLDRRSIAWYLDHYLGGDPATRKNPDASPFFADDLEGSPPALVYTAGFDPLRDEGAAYAGRLLAAGVPARLRNFESMVHGFALMSGVCPAAREAAESIAREIGGALAQASSPP